MKYTKYAFLIAVVIGAIAMVVSFGSFPGFVVLAEAKALKRR